MRFNAILSTDLQRRMKQWPWRLWRLKTVLKSHLHDNSRRTARKTYASIRSKRQEIQKRHTTEQERERETKIERERRKKGSNTIQKSRILCQNKHEDCNSGCRCMESLNLHDAG